MAETTAALRFGDPLEGRTKPGAQPATQDREWRCRHDRTLASSALSSASDLLLYRGQWLRGVHDLDPGWLFRREPQVCVPHAFEERPLLALEMIELARGDALGTHVERSIEQQRQIRLEPAWTSARRPFRAGRARAPPPPLVRERRVGEAIANDPLPGCQRRPDDLLEVLRAGSEHQQCLDLGR